VKEVIGHMGSAADRPGNTIAGIKRAIEAGAHAGEVDVRTTKDGVLVCLHDLTLERTTNVSDVYPTRYRDSENNARHWYVADFTLQEVKQLDAGAWFNERFRGARIATFQEAIDAVRGKAGLYPETKEPEVYGSRGFDMERLLVDALRKNGLDRPGADPRTPVIIQSFSPESLRKLTLDLKIKLPRVFLINTDPGGKWLSLEGLQKAREFASGIGPAKALVETDPPVVKRAHDLGLTVTPYTFRSSSTGRFRDVEEEMRYFLYTLDVDAVFTDNPDRFPRSK